jgi:hypothetical protein
MAMCDYYLCDVCQQKCFYDADKAEYRDGPDGETQYLLNGAVVDIAAICEDCARSHICIVVPRDTYEGVKELAERIFADLCEGDGTQSEALSRSIITSQVSGFVARMSGRLAATRSLLLSRPLMTSEAKELRTAALAELDTA